VSSGAVSPAARGRPFGPLRRPRAAMAPCWEPTPFSRSVIRGSPGKQHCWTWST